MIILIGINKSIIANTYYRIIFLIIFCSLFSFSVLSVAFAQASQETDGKIYTAEVMQVDGTKTKIAYQKDKEGVIVPYSVSTGKLVDGSPATGVESKDRRSNRSIIARYDKESKILLAVVDKNNILGKAKNDIDTVIKKADEAEPISKQELLDGFMGTYVIMLGGVDMGKSISGIETVGRVKLKLSPPEITSIKSEAQKRANEAWKSVLWGAPNIIDPAPR